jgi:polyhydroxyalkanoate synthase
MTAMNDDRADDLRAGAPNASAETAGNAVHDGAKTSRVPTDPPATTAFDIVYQGVLLRLRHYEPKAPRPGPPVLLVHSLFKRPYVLDLLPDRSVVQSLLRQGFSVYLTDWLPPSDADARCGLHDYVERELANAVECIRYREGGRRVGLVGCCLGGFLASVYAALHPQDVERLVVLALPFESQPPFIPAVAEYVVRVYGNVPASWIRAGLNARVADPRLLPGFIATELREPELAQPTDGTDAALQRSLETWFGSDVPFAGQLFLEVMGDAYGRGQFAASQLMIGGQRVALGRICCPVLNVCAEHDRLVPVENSVGFVKHVGTREASNLVFDCGHLGLMLSRAAHASLWPHVGRWIRGEIDAVVGVIGDGARSIG